jgi:hypothetical protein
MSSATKSATSKVDERKYCSSKCKSHKPGLQDRRLEDAFVQLLIGERAFEGEAIPESILAKRTKPHKGEPRIVVPCSVVEELIFGSRQDPTKTSGRKRNRASRVIGEEDSDLEDHSNELVQFTTQGFAGKVRPPQHMTDINGGIGGEKGRAEKGEETEEAAARRKEGLRVTEEKERVKRAARRGVVFGFVVEVAKETRVEDKLDGGNQVRRKCEAVMNGKVVEPSFAKGEWGIRWRE